MRRYAPRSGNWLTVAQAERLINAPDLSTLEGKRDRALLALLIRVPRGEVSELTFECIQQRDGRWVIVDLHGKGNRVRTVPMPAWTTGEVLLPQNIMEMVVKYGERIGTPPSRLRSDISGCGRICRMRRATTSESS